MLKSFGFFGHRSWIQLLTLVNYSSWLLNYIPDHRESRERLREPNCLHTLTILFNKTNNLRFEICRSKLLESCWHSNWRYHSHWGPLFRILPSMAGFSGKRSVVLTESFHNLWDQITKLLNFNNFCFDWTCKLMYVWY